MPDQYLTQYTAAQLGSPCGSLGATAPTQCAGLTTTLGRALRPLQALNTVTAIDSPGRSNYNSMAVRPQKATGHGLSFVTDFSWSSAWDSVFGTSSTLDSGNTSAQDAYSMNLLVGGWNLNTLFRSGHFPSQPATLHPA